jgi:Transcriptional regulator, AbiEi antitoxin/Protein of unknown function (DUF559)
VIEVAIAAVASKQGGHVTRMQLLELGLGTKAIDYRIRTGRLITIYRGVYAVGHLPTLPLDRASGALLACGPEAALCHSSGATLWGFEKLWRFPFDVAVALNGRRPKGIRIHRITTLTDVDIAIHLGVRATSAARTILDIAPTTPTSRLTRIVNDARLARHLTIERLNDVVQRNPRHPGAGKLKPLAHEAGNPTRSTLEDEFKAFCKRFSLPTPLTNVEVAGYEVDALFPDHKLIVELDGYETHVDRRSFERDRQKDADTLQAGFNTIRLTKLRLSHTPETEAHRIHALLAKRAA